MERIFTVPILRLPGAAAPQVVRWDDAVARRAAYGVVMSADRTSRSRVLRYALVVIAILAFVYLCWFALLSIGSEEGDIPPASSLGLPDGTTILTETKDCASGGCWSTIAVRPAEGSSSAELKEHLDTAYNGRVPGTFFDPRTINVMAVARQSVVVVTASYWGSYERPLGLER